MFDHVLEHSIIDHTNVNVHRWK